jgi:hypothetical protein
MKAFHLGPLWQHCSGFISAIRAGGPLKFQEDMSFLRIHTRNPLADGVTIGAQRNLGTQEIIVNAVVTNRTLDHDHSFEFSN